MPNYPDGDNLPPETVARKGANLPPETQQKAAFIGPPASPKSAPKAKPLPRTAAGRQDTSDPRVQAYYRQQRLHDENVARETSGPMGIGGATPQAKAAQQQLQAIHRKYPQAPSDLGDSTRPVNVEDDPMAYIGDPGIAAAFLGKMTKAVAGHLFPAVVDEVTSRGAGKVARVVGKATVSDVDKTAIGGKKALQKPAERLPAQKAAAKTPVRNQRALPKPTRNLPKGYKQPKVVKAGTPRAKQTSARATGKNPRAKKPTS